eukprot:1275170-Pyramimonas_sp.AAC.1
MREPRYEQSDAARASEGLVVVCRSELGEEELVRARLRVDPGAEERLRAMDLLQGDDGALPHALLQGRLLATALGALVAHEGPSVPRDE